MSFPKTRKDDWKRTASAEIEGKNPWETLSWQSPDNISFFPYYDITDREATEYLKKFLLPSHDGDFSDPRDWKNMPAVSTNDKHANQRALQHLAEGADGIMFSGSSSEKIIFSQLLEGIDWPYCSLSFEHIGSAGLTQLAQWSREKSYDLSTLHGAIFGEEKNSWTSHYRELREFTHVKVCGVFIPASTQVNEIAQALFLAVAGIEANKEISATDLIRRVAFSMNTGTDFMLECAKLKALRQLWFQVARAYGADDYQPQDLHIHSRSESWTNEKFQPHGNLLKSTTAAMSAIAGGCDSLTVYPESENNEMMTRMARNVSSVLREESHYSKVADPLAGAYGMDVMVDNLAKAAWEKFVSATA